MKSLILFFVLDFLFSNAQIINTVAGNGTMGFAGDGGFATNAQLFEPTGVAIDSDGNLYIADNKNHRIRKISTSGIITTIVGNGTQAYLGDGGPAVNASISNPMDVIVDRLGNLFIADMYNNVIRKVDTLGIITTVAGNGTWGYSGDGGPAINAELRTPTGIALDTIGNLYIADAPNGYIRLVDTNGIITSIAGNGTLGYSGDGGPAINATINYVNRITTDYGGNIYISTTFDNRIRKIDTNGIITTIAGDGNWGYSGDGVLATSTSLSEPTGLVIDEKGNLYIADLASNRIRMVDTNGIISTIVGNGVWGFAGDGGLATQAEMKSPHGITIDGTNLYMTDYGNNRIRAINNVNSISEGLGSKYLVTISPSPSAQSVKIYSSQCIIEFKLTNLLGKEMPLSTLESTNNKITLDISSFENGIYFITVTSGNQTSTQKLIVQH